MRIAALIALLAGPRAGEPEIDRLRTELRLRTAELEVTRGMLRACQKRAR